MGGSIEMQLIARNVQAEKIGEDKKEKSWKFDLIETWFFLHGLLLISASKIVSVFLLVLLYDFTLMEMNRVSRR